MDRRVMTGEMCGVHRATFFYDYGNEKVRIHDAVRQLIAYTKGVMFDLAFTVPALHEQRGSERGCKHVSSQNPKHIYMDHQRERGV